MQKTNTKSRSHNSMAWLLALSFIAWLPSICNLDHAQFRQLRAGTYTVSRGESLWSIAARVGGRNSDVTSLVDRIAAINQLHGVALQPGQKLHIPSTVGVVE